MAFAQLENRVPTGGSKIELRRCTSGPNLRHPCKDDSECSPGACAPSNKIGLVVNLKAITSTNTSVGWTPTSAQEGALRQQLSKVNDILSDVTDGQMVLDEVTLVAANKAPSATVQLSAGTCAGANTPCTKPSECNSNFCAFLLDTTTTNTGEWGNNGKIAINTTNFFKDPQLFAKELLHLVGTLRDENRGKLDNDGNAFADGCEENLSSNRCFGGTQNGANCDADGDATCGSGAFCGPIRCKANDGSNGCLMEWVEIMGQDGGFDLCFDGNHDRSLSNNNLLDGDTKQSQCHANRSCWTQLGLEWPSVIKVPQAATDIVVGPLPAQPVNVRLVAPNFDRFVAVVDRSGSMLSENPPRLQRAVNAVKDFVGLLSDRSEFGLASFASADGGNPFGFDATKDFPAQPGLQLFDDSDSNGKQERDEAKNAAAELLSRAGGGTRIGAGLRKAHDMLLEAGGAISFNSSVLLLTDGLNNRPTNNPQGDLDAALAQLNGAKLPVFVSCIGEARDSAQCSKIADQTAGRFVDSATTESLFDAFVEFVAQAEKNGIAQTKLGVPIGQGELSAPIPVVVEPGVKEVRFVISWTQLKSDLDLRLVRPNGTIVPPSERELGTQGEFYRIRLPEAGTWIMQVFGVSVPGVSAALPAPDKFSARALLDNEEIQVDAGLARSTISWPSAFLINAAPMFGLPVEGCEVSATVQKPNNTSETIHLHDDGVDGDGDAHDGLYNALYANFTAGDGIYTFLVSVSCKKESAFTVGRAGPGAKESADAPEVPTFERTIRFSGFVTGVPDNLPPVAKICSDVHLECQGALAPIGLDGTCSFDPEGAPLSYLWSSPTGDFSVSTGALATGHFPLGYNIVQLEVADADGLVSSPDVAVVVVEDTSAPTIQSLTASPSTLWPPNHKMVPVTINAQVFEACDSSYSCQIVSVTSNEAPGCDEDGNPKPDWEVTGPLALKLRQERSGNGEGRIYTVQVTCSDASGNESTASVTISVEHDQGQ